MNRSVTLSVVLLWVALALVGASSAKVEHSKGGIGYEKGTSVAESILHQRLENAANSTNSNKHNRVKRGAFEDDCLQAHNKFRRLHSANDLQFDEKVFAFAQSRANYIAASDGAEFKHPPDLPYGENLAAHSVGTTPCDVLIKMFYDEIVYYNFYTGQFSHETGHFTQVVWRSTERVGCARALSDGPKHKGTVYLVCNYDPRKGNWVVPAKRHSASRRTKVEGQG